ncbi:hypothetical protein, partial [Enterococcus faecalis]|uniref:hypothetical protein n=1 Tax=Enterococcus faecalis TaxID=1351 RepID=UPI003CC64F9C
SEQPVTNQTAIEISNDGRTISKDEKTKTVTVDESSGVTGGTPVADAAVIESPYGGHISTNESKDTPSPSLMDEISE